MNRGISVIVSTLLIFAMVISLVIVAYTWGLPILQKSADQGKYSVSLNKMVEIRERIERIPMVGSDEIDISLDSGDSISIYYDGRIGKSILLLRIKVGSQLIPSVWVPLGGYFELPYNPTAPEQEVVGTYGVDKYGVLLGKNYGDSIEMKLILRSLKDEYQRYHYLNLSCSYPCMAGSPGVHKLILRKGEEIINATHTVINIQAWFS